MKQIRIIVAFMALCLATTAAAALPKGLPATATLKAHSPFIDVYVNIEQAAVEEDDPTIVSLWVHNLRTNNVRKLFTTKPYSPPLWSEMEGQNAVSVSMNNIATAEKVFFYPYDTNVIIVEGCPDSRNVWSYLIDIEKLTAKQLCSTSGLVGFSSEASYIIMESYRYNDPEVGGRFPVIKVFDAQGMFIKELELPSDE